MLVKVCIGFVHTMSRQLFVGHFLTMKNVGSPFSNLEHSYKIDAARLCHPWKERITKTSKWTLGSVMNWLMNGTEKKSLCFIPSYSFFSLFLTRVIVGSPLTTTRCKFVVCKITTWACNKVSPRTDAASKRFCKKECPESIYQQRAL